MNTKRVSKVEGGVGGASLQLKLWNGALNALNAADMGMHVLYTAALAATVPPGPAAATGAAAAAGSLAALAALRSASAATSSAARDGKRDIRGLTVVVTGASSGIGFEVCHALLSAANNSAQDNSRTLVVDFRNLAWSTLQ